MELSEAAEIGTPPEAGPPAGAEVPGVAGVRVSGTGAGVGAAGGAVASGVAGSGEVAGLAGGADGAGSSGGGVGKLDSCAWATPAKASPAKTKPQRRPFLIED